MGRIFLSCSPDDNTRAQRIAALLASAGFDLWCSGELALGADWEGGVNEKIATMDCMLVLWSANSLKSKSVAFEARAGWARGAVISVLIDRVPLPAEFQHRHAVDLSDWDGTRDAPAFAALMRALEPYRLRHPSLTASAIPEPAAAAPTPSSESAPPRAAPLGIFSKVSGALGEFVGLFRTKGQRATPPNAEPIPRHDDGVVAPAAAEAAQAEPVLLGVAAPRQAAPGASFSARFVAYVAAAKQLAESHLKDLGDAGDRVVTDIAPERAARWRIGAPITVRLNGEHMRFVPAEVSFEWNGRENLASFAVSVDAATPRGKLLLCFHVLLDNLEISHIAVPISVGAVIVDSGVHEITVRAPSSAFASYSSKDAELVARSLSTLTRWAPSLDIFQDCLDLTANESFKPQLEAQIGKRDVFLLFWSRNARLSKWVLWECGTARAKRGLDAILPMPLEDPAIAPPPPEFEEQHLRDRFMIAGYGLKKIAEIHGEEKP